MRKSPDPFAHVIKKIGENNFKLLNDRDWLYKKYIVENMSSRDIAAILGCGKKSVLASLRRNNIDVSPVGKNKSDRTGLASHIRQMPKAAIGKVDNKKWLYDQFITKNKTMVEISEEMNVSKLCIKRWINKFEIIKSQDEHVESCSRRYEEKNGFKWDSDEAMDFRLSKFKAETIITNKGGIVRCHSSWEKMVAERFDEDDNVASFGKDVTRIKYFHNNKQKTYIVDFRIVLKNNITYLIEVKAPRFLDDDMVTAKFKALKCYADKNSCEYDIIIDPKQAFKWAS